MFMYCWSKKLLLIKKIKQEEVQLHLVSNFQNIIYKNLFSLQSAHFTS